MTGIMQILRVLTCKDSNTPTSMKKNVVFFCFLPQKCYFESITVLWLMVSDSAPFIDSMIWAGCQNNQMYVNFYLQKSLETFDESLADKIQFKKY